MPAMIHSRAVSAGNGGEGKELQRSSLQQNSQAELRQSRKEVKLLVVMPVSLTDI